MEFFFLFSEYWTLGVVLVALWCAIRAVYELWWKPISLQKQLRETGIQGSSYKILKGDVEQTKALMAEAWSKPMALNHDIAARVNPFWAQMLQKYGKISLSWHRRRPRVLVADPGLVKFILNNQSGHFVKLPVSPLVNIVSLGLSTLEGDEWSMRRKSLSPAFHHDSILGMLPSFVTSCCNMINTWKAKLASCQGKLELEIAEEMQQLTSDVISRAAFGTPYEEVKDIFVLQKEQTGLVIKVFMGMPFDWMRFLPTKTVKRMHEIDREIKGRLKNLIDTKTREISEGKAKANLLSLLLQCQSDKSNMMSMDDVIEECKLFYFAGQETTSNLLTWTMILLSMHPNWQDKAREEVLRALGKSTPDVKTIGRLKIVTMILHEVMRLYPPVTSLFRYTSKPSQIGKMGFPAGVEIILPILLLHHDPDIWGEDANEFNPERFANGAAAAGKEESGYFPFGWGPRFCLGREFALMEAKLALAMMLQNFWFELSPSYAHAPFTIFTLQPQLGSPLILHQV